VNCSGGRLDNGEIFGVDGLDEGEFALTLGIPVVAVAIAAVVDDGGEEEEEEEEEEENKLARNIFEINCCNSSTA
jgi:hypothetical protein